MKKIVLCILIFFSMSTWATVTAGAQHCPIQFEGRVKEIISPLGPTNIFSANKVVFEIQRTLKGEVSEQIIVDILQRGPFKLELSHDYKVQLRNGNICWIEEI